MVVQTLPPHLLRRLRQHLLRQIHTHHLRLRNTLGHEDGQIPRARGQIEYLARVRTPDNTHHTPTPHTVDRQREYVVQAVVRRRYVVEHAFDLLLLARIGRIVWFHIFTVGIIFFVPLLLPVPYCRP